MRRRTRLIETDNSYVKLQAPRAVHLRAKLARKRYKSDMNFINAVYRNNKEWIDSRIYGGKPKGARSIKTAFINSVRDYMETNNISAQSAIDILASSETFTPASERFQLNITKAIKNNPEIYSQFKKKLKLGKKEDIDYTKFVYNQFEKGYEYEDYFIVIDNSPKNGSAVSFRIYEK